MKQKLTALILAFSLALTLCACGGGSKPKAEDYVGNYVGQSNSTLILNDDGTCKYSQPNWPTLKGKWEIEDDRLIVRGALDYSIYAELGDSSTSLLFESDSSLWNDELFVKVS